MVIDKATKKLFRGIEGTDINVVKEALNEGANVNAKNRYGDTPLICVVNQLRPDLEYNRFMDEFAFQCVQLLIDHKADVNIRNKDGWSVLMHAIWKGCTEIFTLLLKHGVELNFVTKDGKTPLLAAIEREHVEMAQTLVGKDADVNLAGENSTTPLILAATRSYLGTEYSALIKLLLGKGADANATDNEGRSALRYSIGRADNDTIKMLAEKSDVANCGITLSEAMRIVNKEIVEFLSTRGARPTLKFPEMIEYKILHEDEITNRVSMPAGVVFEVGNGVRVDGGLLKITGYLINDSNSDKEVIGEVRIYSLGMEGPFTARIIANNKMKLIVVWRIDRPPEPQPLLIKIPAKTKIAFEAAARYLDYSYPDGTCSEIEWRFDCWMSVNSMNLRTVVTGSPVTLL